jgi:hypothetical protein
VEQQADTNIEFKTFRTGIIPTHYIEWHTCLSLGFQAHLVSFLTEGVFERFPGFKIVLVEGAATSRRSTPFLNKRVPNSK